MANILNAAQRAVIKNLEDQDVVSWSPVNASKARELITNLAYKLSRERNNRNVLIITHDPNEVVRFMDESPGLYRTRTYRKTMTTKPHQLRFRNGSIIRIVTASDINADRGRYLKVRRPGWHAVIMWGITPEIHLRPVVRNNINATKQLNVMGPGTEMSYTNYQPNSPIAVTHPAKGSWGHLDV